MGTRLADTIAVAHRVNIEERIFWTDSTDVLCWLNSDHRKYSVFVAHRVGEILETTTPDQWRWISTKSNVADEGTKWTNLNRCLLSDRWFSGPEFLQRPSSAWPSDSAPGSLTNEEIRPKPVMINFQVTTSILVDFDRFSKWRRLVRAVAYVARFIENARYPTSRNTGPLTHDELSHAERIVLRDVQREAFPVEYKALQAQVGTPDGRPQALAKTSVLYKRSPYMDERGLIRMSGRIDRCSYADECTKRPVILPKLHRVTDLIVDDLHRRYLHGNNETVMNELRQRYDIPAIRTVCRKVRKRCMACRRREAQPCPPIMCELPVDRLAAFARPFSYTGIDCFGPITVANGRRTEKRWGVLFTCLTVRAIHVEVVRSLSTSDCIMAIRKFVIRRGTPIQIVSDRGTNFVGAKRVLAESLAEARHEMAEEFGPPDMRWRFNPPAAPHFGGAWERMIRSVKINLDRILTRRNPTDAVLEAALVEVEGIINARPLTHVPVDCEESGPLTPNHFLLGSSNGVKPLVAFNDDAKTLLQNWKAAQIHANELWRSWIKGYLPTLTRRTKWFEPAPTLREGDLVLIVDENLPRSCWPMGRIQKAIPSRDGLVRRAIVITAKGKELERPTVKLAVLDVEPEGVF